MSRLIYLSDSEIASGSENGQVYTWNLRKPKEPQTKRYLPFKVFPVGDMQLSEDGHLIVSGGHHTFLRFNARDRNDRGRLVLTLRQTAVKSFAFLPDGRSMAVVFRDGIRVYDVSTGREIARVSSADTRRGSKLAPDGRSVFYFGSAGTESGRGETAPIVPNPASRPFNPVDSTLANASGHASMRRVKVWWPSESAGFSRANRSKSCRA